LKFVSTGLVSITGMKTTLPKWLRYIGYVIFVGFILIFAVVGCGSIEQKKTETRIRHYFGLAPHEPLNSTNIQSALLLQFPAGTPITNVEATLTERGIGKDGNSMMWQTNSFLGCEPYDYSDAWFSMRRIQVNFDLDEQQKVKQIQVDSFDIGL
jgi:hypothetical protein